MGTSNTLDSPHFHSKTVSCFLNHLDTYTTLFTEALYTNKNFFFYSMTNGLQLLATSPLSPF